MAGPSNKVNKPRPSFRAVQKQKREEQKLNPSVAKKRKGSFSGGMSKHRRAKGIVKKRKVNVSTNSTPSGKKLRKLLKARLRGEREANEMQVAIISQGNQRQKNSRSRKAKTPVDTGGGEDVEMKEI
ncbi:uncharacterized protein [Asterias amurensis]|uniref:uncharacterized protein n=1 Tax=Asterias amurensis TaxID=7602 RepID=UPI003AB128F8